MIIEKLKFDNVEKVAKLIFEELPEIEITLDNYGEWWQSKEYEQKTQIEGIDFFVDLRIKGNAEGRCVQSRTNEHPAEWEVTSKSFELTNIVFYLYDEGTEIEVSNLDELIRSIEKLLNK